MPRKKKDDAAENGAQKPIDAARAVKIAKTDILPAQSKVGEFAQEMSTAYKEIKKECNIPSSVMKLGIKLNDMEDYRRDHWLRAFEAVRKELNLFVQPDLVDRAENVVSMGLPTLQNDDGAPWPDDVAAQRQAAE
jgi:hypothetical protein